MYCKVEHCLVFTARWKIMYCKVGNRELQGERMCTAMWENVFTRWENVFTRRKKVYCKVSKGTYLDIYTSNSIISTRSIKITGNQPGINW